MSNDSQFNDAEVVQHNKYKSNYWINIVERFFSNKTSLFGASVIIILILIALFAPLIATHSPTEQLILDRYSPPSKEHFLGTDELGRDVYSRVIYGSRISIQIGIFAVSISMIIGTLLGLISGYFGKWIDQIIMRVIDMLMAFPSILLAIALVAVLGPSLKNAIIAIGVVGIPHFARVVRSAVLSVKEEEYIEAARVIGNKSSGIIFKHVIINCMSPIIVQTTISIGLSILEASGLSFLGLGAQPPTPEWGAMLSDGRAALTTAPWVVAFPGAAIFIVVLGFNLLGDGLRDALDPKLKD